MSPTLPWPYIQPSTGSHFLLKCLLLQITVAIFSAQQLEWLHSAGNLPAAAFAYDLTAGVKDEVTDSLWDRPFFF